MIYFVFTDIMFGMARDKQQKRDNSQSDEDFLAELIRERTKKNPNFPKLLEAAVRRRELVASLAAKRQEVGFSQELVAARMGTSQPAIARLEAGEVDAKLSTLERFATALGCRIDWQLVIATAAPGRYPREGARNSAQSVEDKTPQASARQ